MNILWQVFYKVSAFVNSPEFLRSFFDNRFYLILLVIILMRFKYATYSSMWMSALVNIPGTFLHELMHYLVGSLLNARPVNFTIFPQRNLDGDYVMGSVGFSNITFYNAVPSAMAPTFFNYILYVLLQTIIIENAIPSGADFKVAGMFLRGLLLYAVLAIALLLML